MARAGWKTVLQLLAYLAAVGVLGGMATWLSRVGGPQPYRGVLHCNMAAPGGETTGTLIATGEGVFELDWGDHADWARQALAFDGRPVLVTGQLRVCKGVELRERRIIHVQGWQPDASPVPAPPVAGRPRRDGR